MDHGFVELLRCPETRQPLKLAPGEVVARLNDRITKGHLKNRADQAVNLPIEELLVREDQEWAYPVRGGIPAMIIDEGINITER